MADYFPPSENLPIFDVSVFRSTNDNVITQEEADRLYLSRLGTATSLATSTSFAGTISCGGNLTLTAPLASNRVVEGSYLKLVDNASISTNKPLIWYPDPSLQITTNDAVGAVKTIDLKSFNGTGTGVSTSLTCQYGQVQAQGILKLTQNTNAASFSTITQDATNVTISTTDTVGATRAIILKTFDGLGTGQSAATSISYGQLFANGVIKLANLTNSARFSTFTMGLTELTIANNHTGSTPHINLNTPTAGAGNIITNSPLHLTNKADPTKISTLTQGAADLTLSNTTAAGNITLNTIGGLITSNSAIELNSTTNFKRSIKCSLQYWTDYANVSANVPFTFYDTNALITSTTDVASLQYVNFNSYDGTVTNKYTTFQCGYDEYVAQGALKITQSTNFNNRSTLVMGANDFTVTNTNATGSILLNTTAGKIKYNSPIEPQAGSNPTTLSQIGGTTITTATNLNLATQSSSLNNSSVTLSAGTYMLVGQITYSLVSGSVSAMINWGCGFNNVTALPNTSLGTPYYASNNYTLTTTSGNAYGFSAATSGPRTQTVMNINLTAASTTIYLNFFLTFNTASGIPTFDVFGTIMVTRIA